MSEHQTPGFFELPTEEVELAAPSSIYVTFTTSAKRRSIAET
jgi:hypothetical protein